MVTFPFFSLFFLFRESESESARVGRGGVVVVVMW
jgi:hypothetical protein